MHTNSVKQARITFAYNDGVMSTSEAVARGIEPRTLYRMVENGLVNRLERGLYQLATAPQLNHPDIIVAATKMPKGVVCLISALALHELTTEIPHAVYMALPTGYKKPRLQTLDLRAFYYAPQTHAAGQTTMKLDGITVTVYNKAKTIADCFKFRNKIGLSVATEALRNFVAQEADLSQLIAYAKINRVNNVMRPYIEALI